VLVGEHDLRQVLEIHLMDDAGSRRDDAEVPERVLSPPQELVALAIALELFLDVDEECGVGAVFIDLNRVIDDEVDGLERIDARGGAAEADDGVAHGGEVDDCGHAGEILQQHSARAERDLLIDGGAHVPSSKRLDVGRFDEPVVFVAQEVLEQNAQRHGQPLDGRARKLRGGVQAENRVRRSVHTQRSAGAEGVEGSHVW
jgi:hypothetical protein